MKTKIYKLSTVIIFLIVNLIISSSIFAQAYEKISYQAVIRDADGNLVTNQTIGMQVQILVGAGTAYTETHTPTTNANGLISIEIGGGTLVNGMWSMIYWEYGDCSIKTEIDPTGGTNYTITGTSQLLSVPFAIHAKTAIKADTAEVALIAENVLIYSVGDFAQGGIVFWVDETGQHGLVCAKEDQSEGAMWYAGTSFYTAALGDGLLSGELNTAIIVASQGMGDFTLYAARICNELEITESNTTYGNWYLPSLFELDLMYQNQSIINSTATSNGGSAFSLIGAYWSSTEYMSDRARALMFSDGQPPASRFKYNLYRVRAIRAF